MYLISFVFSKAFGHREVSSYDTIFFLQTILLPLSSHSLFRIDYKTLLSAGVICAEARDKDSVTGSTFAWPLPSDSRREWCRELSHELLASYLNQLLNHSSAWIQSSRSDYLWDKVLPRNSHVLWDKNGLPQGPLYTVTREAIVSVSELKHEIDLV